MNSFLIGLARWILVVPAFLLAWASFNVMTGWLWRLFGLHLIAELIGSPAPGVGVYAAAMVAPFWNKPVSIILALLVTVICGFGILNGAEMNKYGIPQILYACILIIGIVSAWVAVGITIQGEAV